MTGTGVDFVPSNARLTWSLPAPVLRFEGVWWPHSRDAAIELAALLPLVSAHLGRTVRRVSISTTMWRGEHPGWLTVGAHVVQLSWSRSPDSNIVTVARASGDNLILLVIPPETRETAAERVLQRVTGTTVWVGSAHAALMGTATIADTWAGAR